MFIFRTLKLLLKTTFLRNNWQNSNRFLGESFQLLNHCVWRSLVRPQQLNQLEYFISKGLFIGLCCTTTLSPLSYLVLSSCEINARLCRAGIMRDYAELECFLNVFTKNLKNPPTLISWLIQQTVWLDLFNFS